MMRSFRRLPVFGAGLALGVLVIAGVALAAPGDVVRSKNCLVTAIESGPMLALDQSSLTNRSKCERVHAYNSDTTRWEPLRVKVTFTCDGGPLELRLVPASLEKGLLAAQLQASLNQGKRFKEVSTRNWQFPAPDCTQCDGADSSQLYPEACTAALNYWQVTAGSQVAANELYGWKM